MSLFNWFSRKSPTRVEAAAESSGLAHSDSTLPFHPSDKPHGKLHSASEPGHAANRRGERLERRELLYTVVRESMISVGVLSSGYKFKVLSLDSRGVQYLIMMDLASDYLRDMAQLAEIESLIAQNAKSRFDILVTSVYWRVNEQVTTGVGRAGVANSAPAPLNPFPAVAQATASKQRFEPLADDEVMAFKKALASAQPTLSSPGEVLRSGRRNPAPEPTFQDTEIDEQASPLSGTQYGDLR